MFCFGQRFRISLYGASHEKEIGITIDGLPSKIKISRKMILKFINQRKPKNYGNTSRDELDEFKIIGLDKNDMTYGGPINISFINKNFDSSKYHFLNEFNRPGHSDLTARSKYNSVQPGGGFFSGRMTILLVTAGAIAQMLLNHLYKRQIVVNSHLDSIHGSKDFDEEIEKAIKLEDSVGGIVKCIIDNLEIGIGEPYFYSLESVISSIVFSIPGVKGIEFGNGFESANLYGSENNDLYDSEHSSITNKCGGILGGISNGNRIEFRVAFKPTSSIKKKQMNYNIKNKKMEEFHVIGHHDSCYVNRTPIIVKSAALIGLADLVLLKRSFE